MPRTGRAVDVRLRAGGWLYLDTPLHVGAGGRDEGRLDVAVDGRGRLVVPGTSLAGALRSWAERPGPQPHRWGYTEPKGLGGSASRIRVADAVLATDSRLDAAGEPLHPADPELLEPRTGVGIDRFTGAAAAGTLRERMVAPAGLLMRILIDVEATRATLDEDRVHLAGLLAALARGHVRLGAASRAGLGRVRLLGDDLRVVEEHLDSRAGLVAMMRGRWHTWTLDRLSEAYPPPPMPSGAAWSARASWSPATPVVVAAAEAGAAVDVIPLTSSYGRDRVRLVLPGTAIKGALRSHAERLMRTLVDIDLTPPSGSVVDRSQEFRHQHVSDVLVNALFGAPARVLPDQSTPDHAVGMAGAIDVEECYSTKTIPRETWLRLFTDAEAVGDSGRRLPADLRDELAGHGMEVADHVAIDRWTGGAAPGRLYTMLEPYGVAWQPISLGLDVERLRRDHPRFADPACALLLHVLGDLRAGVIPLGYGANRGLGAVNVKDVMVYSPDWPSGADLETALASPVGRRLRDAWRHYVQGRLP